MAAALGGADMGQSGGPGDVVVLVGLATGELFSRQCWVCDFAGDVSAGKARRSKFDRGGKSFTGVA